MKLIAITLNNMKTLLSLSQASKNATEKKKEKNYYVPTS